MVDSARAKAVYVAKTLGRRLRWAVADARQRRRGDALIPPRGLSFVGGGDFERVGNEFLGHFQELGGLQPTDRVLDMGCGIGRMAVPLLDYLEGGSYAGFDVGKEMIGWCQGHITEARPDFEFTWASVYNRKYNPFGSIPAAEFRFPYPDALFDFAFATSLFTHLTLADARHYLSEAARVLRPGGTCLLTFFLLTSEAEREMESGRTAMRFEHEIEGGFTTSPKQPEEAIAYRVEAITDILGEVGLSLREPIHYGQWANHPGAVTGQDAVVAVRG
jgi:ubiquinone/menaquinone biosynthesis C-methylase UbiE